MTLRPCSTEAGKPKAEKRLPACRSGAANSTSEISSRMEFGILNKAKSSLGSSGLTKRWRLTKPPFAVATSSCNSYFGKIADRIEIAPVYTVRRAQKRENEYIKEFVTKDFGRKSDLGNTAHCVGRAAQAPQEALALLRDRVRRR